MKEELVRTVMLLGESAVSLLMQKRVAVFGIGGVGGHVTEALVRSGVGALDLVDNDVVSLSNINRQIIATHETVGRLKTEVMRERIASINPECRVTIYNTFYLPEEREKFPFEEYDYIVDAIDTVTAKIDLALTAQGLNIPIISSMGTGNKLDPSRLRPADIYETRVCPLAKIMRKELRAKGVNRLRVVYSDEEIKKPITLEGKEKGEMEGRRATPGSIAFVPAVAGLIMAGEVIRTLAPPDYFS